MTSAPAIGFEYQPSRWPARALLLIAFLVVLAIGLCALSPEIKLPLAMVVALLVWRTTRKMVTTPVTAGGWSADAGWTLRLLDHEDVPAILSSFRVLGVWVLLRLTTAEHEVHVLVLASDNSDADIRRRLRMRLATMQLGEALPRL